MGRPELDDVNVMSTGEVVPWAPEDLPVAPRVLAREWSYIVLEEIVDGTALLLCWPWPVVDLLGRLQWPAAHEHDVRTAAMSVALLRAQLYTPNGLERHPRCGDTYAAKVGRSPRRGEVHDLRDLFGTTAFDISADARLAAKIAYQASLAPVQSARAGDASAQSALRAPPVDRLHVLKVIAPPPAGARSAR